MPTTEQSFTIDEHAMLAAYLDAQVGANSSVRMRRAILTLLADLRERAAREAERIWDTGQQGAHGGEQCLRTAAAIRKLDLLAPEGRHG